MCGTGFSRALTHRQLTSSYPKSVGTDCHFQVNGHATAGWIHHQESLLRESLYAMEHVPEHPSFTTPDRACGHRQYLDAPLPRSEEPTVFFISRTGYHSAGNRQFITLIECLFQLDSNAGRDSSLREEDHDILASCCKHRLPVCGIQPAVLLLVNRNFPRFEKLDSTVLTAPVNSEHLVKMRKVEPWQVALATVFFIPYQKTQGCFRHTVFTRRNELI